MPLTIPFRSFQQVARFAHFSRSLVVLASIFTFAAGPIALGQTYDLLYAFDSEARPSALITDKAGNLYGTSISNGDSSGAGVVFELTPTADGWTYSVLYGFQGGADGAGQASALIFDTAGNLYGTTEYGGGTGCMVSGQVVGCGTVFKLTSQPGGAWLETILYRFQGEHDGAFPAARLFFNAIGDLYGTASQGGMVTSNNPNCQMGCGVVFSLTPSAKGGWTEHVLHYFRSDLDGQNPRAGLVSDSSGNLYGTTPHGGSGTGSRGMVFELTPATNGGWSELVLYSFGSYNGDGPAAEVVFDQAGNLYGTTEYGGYPYEDRGTVFELSRSENGAWTETVLDNLGQTFYEGFFPTGSLVADGQGNFYGSTEFGGPEKTYWACYSGCGTIFKLTPQSTGWKTSTIYNFTNTDGYYPGQLVIDSQGNLYGPAYGPTGNGNYGSLFEFVP
jgi:uncharacterized repeat protein (TIGR03803 family)